MCVQRSGTVPHAVLIGPPALDEVDAVLVMLPSQLLGPVAHRTVPACHKRLAVVPGVPRIGDLSLQARQAQQFMSGVCVCGGD